MSSVTTPCFSMSSVTAVIKEAIASELLAMEGAKLFQTRIKRWSVGDPYVLATRQSMKLPHRSDGIDSPSFFTTRNSRSKDSSTSAISKGVKTLALDKELA